MNEVKEERFLLSYKELLILLAAKGIQEVYIPKKDEKNPDESETCYILNNMFQNSFINSTGEKFRIVEPLDSMLLKLKEAKRILLFRRKEEFFCIYVSDDDYIVIQTMDNKENQVAVFVTNRDMLLQLFNEYHKENFKYIPILDEEENYLEILSAGGTVSDEKLLKFYNIPYMIEVLEVEHVRISNRLFVRMMEDKISIVLKCEETIQEWLWSEEEMQRQIKQLIGDEGK